MILQDINTASQYLPSLNLTVGNARLNDFFLRSQLWAVKTIIGTDVEAILETPIGQGQQDTHAELRKLVQRLLAVRTYLTVIPEMDLQMSEAGFVVQSNEYMSPASKDRTANLMKSLELRLREDADNLVLYLWQNSGTGQTYATWRNSNQFAHLSSAFMPYSYLYDQLVPPTDRLQSWMDFYNNIPKMCDALESTIASYISEEEIVRLRGLYRSNSITSVHFKAVRRILRGEVAAVRGDNRAARCAAIEARSIMLHNLASFPEFAESSCRNMPTTSMNAGHIINGL